MKKKSQVEVVSDMVLEKVVEVLGADGIGVGV
jgi:hypothetical protein